MQLSNTPGLSSIRTPYGVLVSSNTIKNHQPELDFGDTLDLASSHPSIGNEIHLPITSALNFSTIGSTLGQVGVDQALRAATESHAGALTVYPGEVSQAREGLGNGSIVRLQALLGNCDPQAVEQAIADGADELAVTPDADLLRTGNDQQFSQQIRQALEAADGVLTKVALNVESLDDAQLATACRLAEEAGAKFVRLQRDPKEAGGPLFAAFPRTTDSLTQLVAKNSDLNLEIALEVDELETCEDLKSSLPGRRLRFESGNALGMATSEAAAVAQRHFAVQVFSDFEMKTAGGHKGLAERESLTEMFMKRIDDAHAEGKPVVYVSMPVRKNDAASFEENFENHKVLIEKMDRAGVAYINPFEIEGAPIFTEVGISGGGIQELLMDPATGMWPRILSRCDALIQAPNWKHSTGAREEKLMADAWNIPTWDGTSPLAIRDAAPDRFELSSFI